AGELTNRSHSFDEVRAKRDTEPVLRPVQRHLLHHLLNDCILLLMRCATKSHSHRGCTDVPRHEIPEIRQLQMHLFDRGLAISETGLCDKSLNRCGIGQGECRTQAHRSIRVHMMCDGLNERVEVWGFAQIAPRAERNATAGFENALHLRQRPWTIIEEL